VSGLKVLKFCISFLAIVIGLKLFWGLSPLKQENYKKIQKQQHEASRFDSMASVFTAASCICSSSTAAVLDGRRAA